MLEITCPNLGTLFAATLLLASCAGGRTGIEAKASTRAPAAERAVSNAMIADAAAGSATAAAEQAGRALMRLEAAAPIEVYFENRVDALDTEKGTLTRRYCRRPSIVVRLAFSDVARHSVLDMAQRAGFFDLPRGPAVTGNCNVHPGDSRHLRIKTMTRENQVDWATEWCLPPQIMELEALAEWIESEIAHHPSARRLSPTDCMFK